MKVEFTTIKLELAIALSDLIHTHPPLTFAKLFVNVQLMIVKFPVLLDSITPP